MSWLLACFKCKQRRRKPKWTKDYHYNADVYFAGNECNNPQGISKPVLIDSTLSVEGETFSAKCNALESKGNENSHKPDELRALSSRRSISQVEKIEEELKNINAKLLEGAAEAQNLQTEVRNLRSCTELIESPIEFRKALGHLQSTSEEGQVEENQQLLVLRSLLTKIESENPGIAVCTSEISSPCHITKDEVGSGDQEDSLFPSEIVELSSEVANLDKLVDDASLDERSSGDSNLLAENDGESFTQIVKVNTPKVVDQSELIVLKSPVKEITSDSELALTFHKIIEETVISSEHIDEASKSRFEFPTDTPQTQSVTSDQPTSMDVSQFDMFSYTDSEVDSFSVTSSTKDLSVNKRSSLEEIQAQCQDADEAHSGSQVTPAVCISNSSGFSEISSLASMDFISQSPANCDIQKTQLDSELTESVVSNVASMSPDVSQESPEVTSKVCVLSYKDSVSPEVSYDMSSKSVKSPDNASAAYDVVSEVSPEMSTPVNLENKKTIKATPLRPQVSTISTETPNLMHSQVSPAKLVEDRPILGTVAAHWSHSTSTTQKWWDGKGIPNSTNKYKEDQKVSWHATPFEVRLERALAKQGRVFQKKLFAAGMGTEVEVGVGGAITSPT